MNGSENKFYGKYRGTVFNNADPKFSGRIQALVPEVLGKVPSTWAAPCVPFTGLPGLQSGVYMIPPPQASVWIEFEKGNPKHPIWTGGYWSSKLEVPPLALAGTPASPNIVLQTGGQNTILISGDPVTGITLKVGVAGPAIQISQAGIVMSDGKGGTITMAGGIVSINPPALVIK